MNIYHLTIRTLRKLVSKCKNNPNSPCKPWAIKDPVSSQEIIYNALATGKPCMIARYGATEMAALTNYLGVKTGNKNPLQVIFRNKPTWWWNKSIMDQMEKWSGFFPATENNMKKFGELLLKDSEQLDVLGSWLDGELMIWNIIKEVPKIMLPYLEPFHSQTPWSRILKGKRIVVIHPFTQSINNQYHHRDKIFRNDEILPEFKSLRIVPAVQSLGGKSERFSDWFEALDWMKSEMDKEPYDVALIGCGAYGFHLAAHSKRTGHQAIHLGGALQLLFGIKGKRWESESQCRHWNLPTDTYTKLFNEYWIRPSEKETPKTANQVEDGTYW